MKQLVKASTFYAILGLIFGVYYREFTKIQGFTDKTQLSVLHTHTLMLGMVMFLLILLLERNFAISQFKQYKAFFITYNVGLLMTITMLFVHGTMTVLGKDAGAAIAGIAGLGHIILAVGIGLLFHCISKAVKKLPSNSQYSSAK